MLQVNSHAAGAAPRRQWPALADFGSGGIDFQHLILVFNLYKDCASPIGLGEFRLAIERQRTDNLSADRVDYGGVTAIPIEGENAAGYGFVANRVCVGLGMDCPSYFQGFQIEEDDASLVNIADKSAIPLGHQCNPMYCLVGDRANLSSTR